MHTLLTHNRRRGRGRGRACGRNSSLGIMHEAADQQLLGLDCLFEFLERKFAVLVHVDFQEHFRHQIGELLVAQLLALGQQRRLQMIKW